MSFKPTAEQTAIVARASSEDRPNILVQALAGAAKTTTLLMIAESIRVPTTAIAFNKRIADELQSRFPGHVNCRTFNSIGHRAWNVRRKTLNAKKSGDLYKSLILSELKGDELAEASDRFGDITSSVSFAKNLGYVPEPYADHSLISRSEFYDLLEHKFEPFYMEAIDSILVESIEESKRGHIDFDDQLYMPVLFGGHFNRTPLVLIDEAQDMSPINLELAKKLKAKQIIAVGDRYQAIYAFRGAMSKSMDKVKETFNMEELPLTVSFRCPKAVVLEARVRASHMRALPNAREGKVENLHQWKLEDIPPSAAILCRNNGPLFRLAFALIKLGKGCQIAGAADLARSFHRLFTTFKKQADRNFLKLEDQINGWHANESKKSKNQRRVEDLRECLMIIAKEADFKHSAAIAVAQRLFEADGTITLMTGHKSKGFEFENVFIYNRDLIDVSSQQEKNLLYVMRTRSKDYLAYITTDGCENFWKQG